MPEPDQHPSLYQRLTSYLGTFGSSNTPPTDMPNQVKKNATEVDESSMPTKAESEITKTRLLLRADQVIAMTDGVIHQQEGVSEPIPRMEEGKKEKSEVITTLNQLKLQFNHILNRKDTSMQFFASASRSCVRKLRAIIYSVFGLDKPLLTGWQWLERLHSFSHFSVG